MIDSKLTLRRHIRSSWSIYLQFILVLSVAWGSIFSPSTSCARTLSLIWSANPESVEGYRLYYKKGVDPSFPYEGTDAAEGTSPIDVGNQTSFTLTGLDDNATYHFALTAYSGSEESDYSTVASYTPSSPDAYTFTWLANSEKVLGYKLYYKKGEDQSLPFAGTSAVEGASPIDVGNTTSFSVSGLDASSTYQFALTAYDSTTESPFSEIVTLTTSGATDTTGPLAAVLAVSVQSGEAPLAVDFDGSGSTGLVESYSWSFGDGNTGVGQKVLHTYQSAGIYTATLTITDTNKVTAEDSLEITASDSTTTDPVETPPSAVISSSTAVGETPLLVEFDGSSSSTEQPPITSFSWLYGDGSGAEGALTDHTFSTAGTYETTLTVTDSANLTDTVGTPVIVSEPDSDNQAPVASFTANPSSGGVPLKVYFDASGSSDGDGSISEYLWSFGDGSTETGMTPQHTYVNVADYNVSLQVTDDRGATASTSTLISALAEGEVLFNFELGEVQVDHNWSTVLFNSTFVDPVVIAGPPSYAGADPATISIRNINLEGFEVHIQEWDYLDGNHVPETFSYIVMEKGAFTLSDGTLVEAGSFTGARTFQQVPLQQSYTGSPVILTQVITVNDSSAFAGRVRSVTNSSFEYMLQKQENTKNFKSTESIGYIAWGVSSGEIDGLLYESGFTAQGVDQDWFDLTFKNEFPDLPLFIAGMQTINGNDPAVLRMQNPTKASTQIKVEEEQSKDDEVTHNAENIGYLVIGESTTTTTEPGVSEPSQKKIGLSWEYPESTDVTGYKIYLNDSLLCETTDSTVRQLSCDVELLSITMNFSMTAVFADGSESTPSNLYSIEPTDYPELFGLKLTTFSWEFDSSQESSITGFRIFNNNSLVCEIADPTARQLACQVSINDLSNSFNIKAVEATGAESTVSNTMSYSP